MPIIFVHGVSGRKYNNYVKTWEVIEGNLRKYVAPVILTPTSNEPSFIEEAFWGDVSVPFYMNRRASIPNDERVMKLIKQKSSWIARKIEQFEHIPESDRDDFLWDLIPEAGKKLIDLPGYLFGRVVDPLRRPLNENVTLFLGDIFFYLARRGTADNPGKITTQLLEKLIEAHNIKIETGEPLIVFSHSMGGQLVYDIISYYLPKISQIPGNEKLKDISIDFWCAAASQVGLFKEMKVFKQDDDGSTAQSKQDFLELDLGVATWKDEIEPIEQIDFPSQHLKIWWNLWDDSDYLSFTVEPFIKEVFDDLYDSGKSPAQSHTSHFDDPDFYKQFALLIQEAKSVNWDRQKFLQEVLSP
ncbi:hypothetical protein H6G94_34230 [Nostoc punctiforme FACHB-252]|uniref:Alpha/beta hydrolase n=1 Tax=Nostoc punctiforme FACHB-252 TaxID=1357509 RepID=A0ABR8HK65_NOSPU|nr:hypothetical protein [Nostoc punctiforme]MBD2616245.1 hypothetical protein [Nostoc punctiforme FACHB-252]